MPSAEYQRERRARLKSIERGDIPVPEKKVVLNHADYMKQWRQTEKGRPHHAYDTSAREAADAAMANALAQRGRQITEMMNTPTCMWKQDWFEQDEVIPVETEDDLPEFNSLIEACDMLRNRTHDEPYNLLSPQKTSKSFIDSQG
jgi:hypothetical protein